MLIESSLSIAASHPCLADHFPGHPIVPGALLLSEAIAAGQNAGLPTVRCVVVAKFTASLPPDTKITLIFESRLDGKIRLSCRGEGDRVTYLTAVLDCREA